MKKILLLMPVVLWFIFIGCENVESNKNRGKKYLYEIKVWEKEYKFGEFTSYRKRVQTYRYDPNGNLIYTDSLSHSWAGDITNTTRYTYDGAGLLVEREKQSLSYALYKYSHDENGLISEIKKYNKDGKLSTIWTHTYENGRLIKIFEDEILLFSDYYNLYEYNNKGLVSQIKRFHADDTLFYTYVFTYDDHGSLLTETNVSPEGKEQIVQNYTYEYNADGTICKKTDANLYGWYITIYEYTYDAGNKVSVTISNDNDGVVQPEYLHEYEYVYKVY